jgi:hypothetical protein
MEGDVPPLASPLPPPEAAATGTPVAIVENTQEPAPAAAAVESTETPATANIPLANASMPAAMVSEEEGEGGGEPGVAAPLFSLRRPEAPKPVGPFLVLNNRHSLFSIDKF